MGVLAPVQTINCRLHWARSKLYILLASRSMLQKMPAKRERVYRRCRPVVRTLLVWYSARTNYTIANQIFSAAHNFPSEPEFYAAALVRHTQNHYIKVAQGDIFSRSIHNWLAYSKFTSKPKKKFGFLTFIWCNFLEWILHFFKEILNHFFAPENMKKTLNIFS
jgi:hypothetical protein